MISPTIRSLITVANELSRCIDNIASIKDINSYTTSTLISLSALWTEYHTLAEQPDIDDYIIYPEAFRRQEAPSSTPEVPSP